MFFDREYFPRDKNIDWTKFASSESASNCLPPRFYPKENLTNKRKHMDTHFKKKLWKMFKERT